MTLRWHNIKGNLLQSKNNFEVIPSGTIAKVRMDITRGGYNDPKLDLTDDVATLNSKSGNIYLDACFTILDGDYAKRKVWTQIGLWSKEDDSKDEKERNKGWGAKGRVFIRGIVDSARRLDPDDVSEQTDEQRTLSCFDDLERLKFVACIDVRRDKYGNPITDKNGRLRNVIKGAITKDMAGYEEHMGSESDAVVGPAIWGGVANGAGAAGYVDDQLDDLDDGIPF